jgi:hypothetical protein
MGPRNESEVTFREYIDNRFKSLEQRFDEWKEAHKEVHAMGQLAFDEYKEGTAVKLHDVNKLRDQAVSDREEFLRSDIYDREHQALELKLDQEIKALRTLFQQQLAEQGVSIRNQLTEQALSIKSNSTWIDGMTGKLVGAGIVIIALASFIAWVIPHPWGK